MPFVNINPYLAIILSSILPISEIRGALPLGILVYKLSFLQVFILAVFSNILIACLFFFFLKYLAERLRKRIKPLDKILNVLFARTHQKFYNKHQSLGDIALLLFVAIPLPLTGGYTGAIAAFLFDIPAKKTIPLLAGGILIAGIIVSIITLGIDNIFY